MNKQKLIDKAVEELKGKLPPEYHPDDRIHNVRHEFYVCEDNVMQKCLNESTAHVYGKRVCDIKEFQQRTKELGWVNTCKWGVEYQTNGKKPDLPDNLMVQFKHKHWGWNSDADGVISCEVKHWDWSKSTSFRIIDERYKPVEQKPAEAGIVTKELQDEMALAAWWDYETNKPAYEGALPPVGSTVLFDEYSNDKWQKVQIRGFWTENGNTSVWIHSVGKPNVTPDKFRPLDHETRAKELECKRVVDAAYKEWNDGKMSVTTWLNKLYDKGFLKLPENYNE